MLAEGKLTKFSFSDSNRWIMYKLVEEAAPK